MTDSEIEGALRRWADEAGSLVAPTEAAQVAPVQGTVRVETPRTIGTRRRWAVGAIAAVAVVFAAIISWAVVGGDSADRVSIAEDGAPLTAPPPPTSAPRTGEDLANDDAGVFTADTGLVMLASDGLGGAAVVDLDDRRAVRRVVEGSRAGDQPHRFTRVGDDIVVGWGSIHAVDIATARSRDLAQGTIYVPDDDDSIWVIDWPGGRIGAGEPSYKRVAMDGSIELEVSGPSEIGDAFPERGAGEYLVFSRGPFVVWNPAEDRVVRPMPGRYVTVLDVVADRILVHDRQDLWLSSVEGGDRMLDLGAVGEPLIPSTARLSPDGRQVAVLAGAIPDDGSTGRAKVVVHGVVSGETTVYEGTVEAVTSGGLWWSPDGSQLFHVGRSYQEGSTSIARVELGGTAVEEVTLPFGGLLGGSGVVLLDRREAEAWLDAEMGPAAECPPTVVYDPSAIINPCGFDF